MMKIMSLNINVTAQSKMEMDIAIKVSQGNTGSAQRMNVHLVVSLTMRTQAV